MQRRVGAVHGRLWRGADGLTGGAEKHDMFVKAHLSEITWPRPVHDTRPGRGAS
ncbi:hypothetical protein GCM10009677_05310 [Sphaerisporangium rubeum]